MIKEKLQDFISLIKGDSKMSGLYTSYHLVHTNKKVKRFRKDFIMILWRGYMKKVQGHGVNDMSYGWASENEWNNIVYRKWQRMIYRCYNEEYHKTHPKYIGCTVCERWLTLSNFVEDVPKIDGYDEERFLNGELELDKDKKNDTESKSYSMTYCTWLPKPENRGLAGLKWEGKHHTEESKRKMSEAHKGKQLSEETKLKMSESKQGENNPMQGKFGSEHHNSKKVVQYDKQTDELIKIWDSIMDIERELGIAHQHISSCCKGKRKSAGGYIWKYVEDE